MLPPLAVLLLAAAAQAECALAAAPPPALRPCRSKRRSSVQAQLPAGDLPVTRSGHVRRSAEGLVNRRTSGRLSKPPAGDGPADMEVQQAQTAQRAAADRRASGVFSLGSAGWQARASPEAAPAALYVVRGRTCAVVDDCLQDDPARCVALCVRSFTGLEVGGAVCLSLMACLPPPRAPSGCLLLRCLPLPTCRHQPPPQPSCCSCAPACRSAGST